MTTQPTNRDHFADWRPAAGTRQYCGELELTIPIDRDNYFTITADPDTVAMVPVVLRQLLAQPEPEGPTDKDLDDLANEMLDWNCEGWRAYARAVIAADRARFGRPAIEPVPGAERPWEREGWCNSDNEAFFFNSDTKKWSLYKCDEYSPVMTNASDRYTHSLPHHALPVPGAEVG